MLEYATSNITTFPIRPFEIAYFTCVERMHLDPFRMIMNFANFYQGLLLRDKVWNLTVVSKNAKT